MNHPTLSYKDRVVSVAATRAVELGFKVLACASTGNLANSVAAHAARLGIECCVFIPDNLEAGKLLGSAIFNPTILAIAGNYDDVNRLCTQVARSLRLGLRQHQPARRTTPKARRRWASRSSSSSGWRYPKHLVSPVAGGTLLPRIVRGLRELREIGLVDGELPRVHAAQAAGCAPVVHALEAGLEHPEPVRPEHHRQVDRDRQSGRRLSGDSDACKATGGTGAAVTDKQIVDAIQLLAETEGIFTEPAGGTTLAATIDLIERGVIPRDESVVVCVTGNGYKTAEVVAGRLTEPVRLSRAFKEFEAWQAVARRAASRAAARRAQRPAVAHRASRARDDRQLELHRPAGAQHLDGDGRADLRVGDEPRGTATGRRSPGR